MAASRGTVQRPSGPYPRPIDQLWFRAREARDSAAVDSWSVLLLGLDELPDDCWAVLVEAGIRLQRAADVEGALRALTANCVPVLIVSARVAGELTAALRARAELEAVYVVGAATVGSPDELRDALDAGVDDVIRVPFEPEVLVARVASGLRAGRLRAGEALFRSLVASIPGAIYRCAWDADWTMEWLSEAIEEITGYPASDFINSSARTFASVIHPEDREYVQRSVREAVSAGRPFTLEYRMRRRDGRVCWVLERGQTQESGDGRRWLDGAIFDITVRRAAERALRQREVVEAQLAEVRASRARIVEAGDRARREIEHNLHDGAQQRFLSATLQLQCLVADPELSDHARADLEGVLAELRAALSELRDLAHGLHPAALTTGGLEGALTSLADHAGVPVELRLALPASRLAGSVEAAAYFMVSEALTNVARYARASRAWVEVSQQERHLAVEVGDDGAGGVALRPGCGLQGLCDRIAAINGTLNIESERGAGTVLRARLPIE
jgi:PAS domain S-box-containing protein